jgi:hypothetical protein
MSGRSLAIGHSHSARLRGKIGAAVRLHSLHADGAVAGHLQGDPDVRQRVVCGVEIRGDLVPPFRIRFLRS